MARVKRGVTSHAKHKKVYKATKGHYGRGATPSASPSRRWKKRTSTPTATARRKSARSVRCGSSA